MTHATMMRNARCAKHMRKRWVVGEQVLTVMGKIGPPQPHPQSLHPLSIGARTVRVRFCNNKKRRSLEKVSPSGLLVSLWGTV
jgi:hypothetical protein